LAIQTILIILDIKCQVKNILKNIQTVNKRIGEIIRELREQKSLLLRQVAAEIEIDQALLSKIERNERMPTKDQVKRFAKFFEKNENELLIAFLSDKLVYEVQDEEVALKAMQVAEKKINYIIKNRNGK
jgi:transcriptional regulator with XRE-family HTH domain